MTLFKVKVMLKQDTRKKEDRLVFLGTYFLTTRRRKNTFLISVYIASSFTLDSLESLSGRVLEMTQKRCNLLKARLSEKYLQLSSLDERNSSNYARNMLMAQMKPVVRYNQLIGRYRQSTLLFCCCSKEH